jgi:outer membrane autotransporter protein
MPLPPLWEASIREHQRIARIELEEGRRRAVLPMSVLSVIAAMAVPKPAFSAEYTQTVTGDASVDSAYSTSTDASGRLVYAFADGDSIKTATSAVEDINGIKLEGSQPVVLQVGDGSGVLNVSAQRAAVGSWGTAFGIDLEGGSNLTVNGKTSVYARSDDATTTVNGQAQGGSAALGVRIYQAAATFNGDLSIETYTPAYSQGLWVYQGDVTVNGKTTILTQARGASTSGLYNSGGGRSSIVLNGDADITAYGMWPSDNVHGIYNDGINSRLRITGNLNLNATSNGSTVFGIRNQGVLEVDGDAYVSATGPRSALGIANTHRTARMYWHGNVVVEVNQGTNYTPFGLPTAISSIYGRASSMNFDKGVSATITAGAETYGINNNSILNFNSDSDTVYLRAHSNCDGCSVYGISNWGGVITMQGGLDAEASGTGSGKVLLINNMAVDGETGEININAAGKARVALVGDISTASLTNASGTDYAGTTTINFTGDDAFLGGNVTGYVDPDSSDAITYRSGATWLRFADGASWKPTGTGNISADFGAGGLTLATGGIVDMSASWGSFAPGSVPSYSLRTLTINSSTGNGSVTLEDGAKFLLLSDIRNGAADKIVFGSGISSFNATGTQSIGIVYDPVLDDTSWINDAALQVGKWITALSEVDVVDASQAAGGTAKLAAIAGLESSWRQTYENDLIAFSYKPTLALSSDGSKVLLTGIQIIGNGGGSTGGGSTGGGESSGGDGGSGSGGESGGSDSGSGGSSGGDSGGSTGGGETGGGSSGGEESSGGGTGGGSTEGGTDTPAIRPSETVLTAADAVDGLRSLWLRSADQTRAHAARVATARTDDVASAWVSVTGGRDRVDTAYSRQYTQDVQAVSVGVEQGFLVGDSASLVLGASATQGRAQADYTRGDGKLRSTGLTAYAEVIGGQGAYLWGSIGGSRLRNQYRSLDSEGRRSAGTARADAVLATLEAGWPISIGDAWSLTPQISVSSGTMRGERHVTSTGVTVDVQDADVTQARAGASLARSFSGARTEGELYLKALRLQSFGDDVAITASKDGGEISTETGPERRGGYEFAAGASLSLRGSQLSAFAEAGRQRYTGVTGDWAVSAGVRYRW